MAVGTGGGEAIPPPLNILPTKKMIEYKNNSYLSDLLGGNKSNYIHQCIEIKLQ